MSHLKMAVMRDGITDFLTYADNFAIGYFRKQVRGACVLQYSGCVIIRSWHMVEILVGCGQGFSLTIAMEKRRWKPYIKDYEGGTLMHCVIAPGVDHRYVIASMGLLLDSPCPTWLRCWAGTFRACSAASKRPCLSGSERSAVPGWCFLRVVVLGLLLVLAPAEDRLAS